MMGTIDELEITHFSAHPPPELNKENIERIEGLIGTKLPDFYIQFLMQNNGGYPEPDTFYVGELYMGVNNFFCITTEQDAKRRTDSVQWNYRHRWEDAERDILPIAGDGLGNLICLDMSETGKGTVVMWIHDPLLPVQYVADSFKDFLELLEPYHED